MGEGRCEDAETPEGEGSAHSSPVCGAGRGGEKGRERGCDWGEGAPP